MTKVRIFLFIFLIAITAYSKDVKAETNLEQQGHINIASVSERGEINYGR